MVSKENIEKAIHKSIKLVKCHDYPKATALQNFNETDYQTETWNLHKELIETVPSPVGRHQQIQANLQEQINYNSIEKGVASDYSTNSFIPLNMYLNNVPDWEKKCKWIGYDFGHGFVMPVYDEANDKHIDMSMPQESRILSEMIDKSPRVTNNSIVYRYGALPMDIREGGHGRFKGFTSTSYNEYIAFKDIPEGGGWVQGEKDIRYKMRIFTPTGTKGMVLNRHTGCVDWQSELLLDKNQRYIVLKRDDTNLTADILLY